MSDDQEREFEPILRPRDWLDDATDEEIIDRAKKLARTVRAVDREKAAYRLTPEYAEKERKRSLYSDFYFGEIKRLEAEDAS